MYCEGVAVLMRKKININYNWDFTEQFSERFALGESCETTRVDLPHTCAVTPFNHFDESIYQMVCGYRKKITLPEMAKDKRIFLIIGAAGHSAQVYVKGKQCGERHLGGYTSFETELTEIVHDDIEFLLSVEVDSREQQNIPPFGNVVDYMTYGGLYREVWLEIRENSYIEDVFIRPTVPDEIFVSASKDLSTEFDGTVESRITITHPESSGSDEFRIRQSIFKVGSDPEKSLITAEFSASDTPKLSVPGAMFWDVETPNMYKSVTELIDKCGNATDTIETQFGFRRAFFKSDGFYLNGRKLKLIGLNRHQSYPYIGYAAPASMQRSDADILKFELGLNAVRTSHYPQSQHFIDRCDQNGLLVFTEIPGWQHIGNVEWKKTAINTTSEMVRQYRNHPSVVLWGVRINESPDDDDFYEKTNNIAHLLDDTRQTGGVRCIKNSNLLEDVYTYNDFIHDGTAPGCEAKSKVTSDTDKPYLISEYCGHMFPTKSSDCEEHRLEHALRHARILDCAASYEDIAGTFGWCFFDYNTHKDFGSGDRICYHGICDMFRNPKLASSVYAVNQTDEAVLEISSSMDIGEHPASVRGHIYVFTNADSVRFYKNDRFIREYTHKDSPFTHLKYPPIEIDDFIGEQIKEGENFTPRQAEYVKSILNESARFGISKLSLKAKLKAAWLMMRYRMNFEDAYALYGKYIENWGARAVEYRFEGVKNGKTVKTVVRAPFKKLLLKAKPDHTDLIERTTYDVSSIRITAADQNGNILPYFVGVVNIDTNGPIEIIGPHSFTLQGGMGGTFVKTKGGSGKATVNISTDNAPTVTIEYNVKSERRGTV